MVILLKKGETSESIASKSIKKVSEKWKKLSVQNQIVIKY